jgi:hypothetical protein
MQDDQATTAAKNAEPPGPPAAGRDAGAPAADGRSEAAPIDGEEGPAGARPPEAYTEPPGSHRRPEDGAALDVGG